MSNRNHDAQRHRVNLPSVRLRQGRDHLRIRYPLGARVHPNFFLTLIIVDVIVRELPLVRLDGLVGARAESGHDRMPIHAGVFDQKIVAGRQQRPQNFHLGQYVILGVVAIQDCKDLARVLGFQLPNTLRDCRLRGRRFYELDLGVAAGFGIKSAQGDVRRKDFEGLADQAHDARIKHGRAAMTCAEFDHQRGLDVEQDLLVVPKIGYRLPAVDA